MQQRWKWLFALAVFLLALSGSMSIPAAYAGVPDVTQSYFVPQSGSVTTPTEGAAAIANARRCPASSTNNSLEGTQVLRLNSRLKVVVKASDGSPIAGIAATDICVLFNGGTPAQGFSGVGDDSIIANFQFNQAANCPDVRCVAADAPTDVNGVTYITWLGASPSNPGVALSPPDPSRKWGGWAGDIPVMVLGFKLQGRLTSISANGSYTCHVKSFDSVGGRTTATNQGELVNSLDINPVQAAITSHAYVYNLDFDNNGIVNSIDRNFIVAHNNHRCNVPAQL
jgi:hypothetical protein